MLKPSLIIGTSDNPYMLRWHLVKLFGWQLALHYIRRSDDDRALHDHSGDNWSLIIGGIPYSEVVREWLPDDMAISYNRLWNDWTHNGDGEFYRDRVVQRRKWRVYFRKAEAPHRLILAPGTFVWSIWLRMPARRTWGFHCPLGWKPWKEFIGEDYRATGKSPIGRGC